ncbi:MAG: hypothetical protein RL033_3841, partial [Pseudomonadota bacterium]
MFRSRNPQQLGFRVPLGETLA